MSFNQFEKTNKSKGLLTAHLINDNNLHYHLLSGIFPLIGTGCCEF